MDPIYLFNTGKNYQSYRLLGVHRGQYEGQEGFFFRVWAPRAKSVALIGSFNDWQEDQHFLEKLGSSGIWQGFRTDISLWDRYQYLVEGADGKKVAKADPFAMHQETRPGRASIVYFSTFDEWTDGDFADSLPPPRASQPLNIYEVHLASWRTYEDGNPYNYRQIADQLAPYCQDMGYNAVELMPVMEYPFDASWGYQVTGYFAPTSRFGTPDDFKYMVNRLHAAGIRVILDWVPAHFPKDDFGLYRFDGSPCYEYSDPRMTKEKEWGTMAFDYGKAEVRSFLLSSAYYWLDEFHADGLRVDAVSFMIYLNYGLDGPNKLYNRYGGEDNLDALDFFKALNGMVQEHFPKAFVIAEESTAYPYISKPLEEGGLGFTHKWNMGWMHDTLDYMGVDYYARGQHHNQMTFSLTYAFSENYILPFSHDEVVHGKKSLIGRMPGDIWRQFASLRTCFAWQIGHPGAKLNFMGNEFGQFIEWRFYEQLEWFLLDYPNHQTLQAYSRALNHFYLDHPALWEDDHSWQGFQWVQADDRKNSVYAFFRKSREECLLVVLNMTPAVLDNYKIHVPQEGTFTLLFNSNDAAWGGSSYLGQNSQGKTYQSRLPATDRESGAAEAENGDDVTGMKAGSVAEENGASCEDLSATRDPDQTNAGTDTRADTGIDTVPDTASNTSSDTATDSRNTGNQPWPELVLDLPPLSALFFHFDSKPLASDEAPTKRKS